MLLIWILVGGGKLALRDVVIAGVVIAATRSNGGNVTCQRKKFTMIDDQTQRLRPPTLHLYNMCYTLCNTLLACVMHYAPITHV